MEEKKKPVHITSLENEILLETEPLIIQLVNSKLRGWTRQHIEDIEQVCRIKIWQSAEKYDPEKGSICAWSNTIICNCIIDELRKLKRRKEFHLFEKEILAIDPPQEFDDADERAHQWGIINNTLPHLTPNEQETIDHIKSNTAPNDISNTAWRKRKSRVTMRLQEEVMSQGKEGDRNKK